MSGSVLQPGHAPGWSWRKDIPETLDPFATLNPAPSGCIITGLCELGWHRDCNQAPWQPGHPIEDCPNDHPRRCVCPCHTDPALANPVQLSLFEAP